MSDRAVLVFAKPPVAGRVKTRLVGGRLTESAAAELQAAFLDDLLARLAGVDADLRVCWALGEDEPVPAAPAGGRRQAVGDLGVRLTAAFRASGAARRAIAVVGSDHPDLPAERVEEAFGALAAGADLVLGPASDGGFYLVAGRPGALDAALFGGLPWSTAGLLAAIVARAAELALRTELLAEASDVDTPADLERLAERLRGLPPGFCPRTRQQLARLGWRTEAA